MADTCGRLRRHRKINPIIEHTQAIQRRLEKGAILRIPTPQRFRIDQVIKGLVERPIQR